LLLRKACRPHYRIAELGNTHSFLLTFLGDCLYVCTPDLAVLFWKGKMKPTATHHLIPLAAWRHKPKHKDAILERMRSLTRELAAIQTEMHNHLAGAMAGSRGSLLEDAEALPAVNDLKAELDQVRRILWFYIEEAARKPLTGADQQGERVQPAPLALVAQSAGSSAGAEPGWFFDRLNLVIDSYIQKKPAAAESTARRAQTKTSS
jgi:hypothetical protein